MDRPNFLIIMSDKHHAGTMGCAGDNTIRTPNLDRLSANGVRFNQCYTASPLCVPARMAFLTGQYPSDTRAWCNENILGSDIPTFAHPLGVGGYETVLCGRMHFCGPDQRHGFEKRLVGDITGVHHRQLRPDADHLMKDMWEAMGQSLHAASFSGPGRSYVLDYDDQVTDACVDFPSTRAMMTGRCAWSSGRFYPIVRSSSTKTSSLPTTTRYLPRRRSPRATSSSSIR